MTKRLGDHTLCRWQGFARAREPYIRERNGKVEYMHVVGLDKTNDMKSACGTGSATRVHLRDDTPPHGKT